MTVSALSQSELASSWTEAWVALRLQPGHEVFPRLLKAYSRRHRAYHNLTHIGECLLLLRSLEPSLSAPSEVTIALWFHDAVYQTYRKDNEKRSAAWARQVLTAAGARSGSVVRVVDMILATASHAPSTRPDVAALNDVDMAILGASEERFLEYETQIRREYWWVLSGAYRRARLAFYRAVLSHEAIFTTPALRATLESQARENLRRGVDRLGA